MEQKPLPEGTDHSLPEGVQQCCTEAVALPPPTGPQGVSQLPKAREAFPSTELLTKCLFPSPASPSAGGVSCQGWLTGPLSGQPQALVGQESRNGGG